jgi:hypothetical protein
MSTMLVESCDALKEAWASEEKARAAAASLTGRDQRWNEWRHRTQQNRRVSRWGGWIVAGLSLYASACGGGADAAGSDPCQTGLQAYYARHGYPSTAAGETAYQAAIAAAKASVERARLQPYYAKHGYPSTAAGETAYDAAIASAKRHADRTGLQAYYARYGHPSTAAGKTAYDSAIASAKAYAKGYVPPADCRPPR